LSAPSRASIVFVIRARFPVGSTHDRRARETTFIVNPILVGIVVFACTFCGALAGMLLRRALPSNHLDEASKETIKLGIGLIATMTALVLGLVTASAKSSFDEVTAAIKHAAADVLALDRTLARYGPQADDVRAHMRASMAQRLEMMWPTDRSRSSELDSSAAPRDIETVAARIRGLRPQTDEQRWLQSRALHLGESLFQRRSLIVAGTGSSVPLPFLVILLFWLTITFASFGLFAPGNATVVSVLLVCALSVAGAVFLVLELDGPFQGLIKVSGEPLRFAVSRLGQ
jgi:hypothetical protein